jgi:hypothetical protein
MPEAMIASWIPPGSVERTTTPRRQALTKAVWVADRGPATQDGAQGYHPQFMQVMKSGIAAPGIPLGAIMLSRDARRSGSYTEPALRLHEAGQLRR